MHFTISILIFLLVLKSHGIVRQGLFIIDSNFSTGVLACTVVGDILYEGVLRGLIVSDDSDIIVILVAVVPRSRGHIVNYRGKVEEIRYVVDFMFGTQV